MDRNETTVQKAITVKRKHIDMADEMAFAIGREDPTTGETNFSGVVRDAMENLYKELDRKKMEEDE